MYDKGRSHADRFLVMFALENGRAETRLGISVSKRNGNSVVRHRLKRIIKEAFRLNEARFKRGYDVVLIARNPSIGEKSTRMEKSIQGLAKKLHVWNTENKIGE